MGTGCPSCLLGARANKAGQGRLRSAAWQNPKTPFNISNFNSYYILIIITVIIMGKKTKLNHLIKFDLFGHTISLNFHQKSK